MRKTVRREGIKEGVKEGIKRLKSIDDINGMA
jgi:hypothetical protein